MTADGALTLYDYWRSGAAWRVRIALNWKGLAFTPVPVNLLDGEQSASAYGAVNPQHLVPTLAAGDLRLTQSLAILEWLEERHPSPPLLPADPDGRAIVRSMAQLICADIHPLQNLRVQKELRARFGAQEPDLAAWIGVWIGQGFTALETLVARHGQAFAYGDAPSFADACIAPQVYSARRFSVDLTPYPRLMAAAAAAAALPAFQASHPDAIATAVPKA